MVARLTHRPSGSSPIAQKAFQGIVRCRRLGLGARANQFRRKIANYQKPSMTSESLAGAPIGDGESAGNRGSWAPSRRNPLPSRSDSRISPGTVAIYKVRGTYQAQIAHLKQQINNLQTKEL